jgi:chromosome segregation ATPase
MIKKSKEGFKEIANQINEEFKRIIKKRVKKNAANL